jgi:hypothetical protein
MFDYRVPTSGRHSVSLSRVTLTANRASLLSAFDLFDAEAEAVKSFGVARI